MKSIDTNSFRAAGLPTHASQPPVPTRSASQELGGLAGWIWRMLRDRQRQQKTAQRTRQLEIVEQLALGAQARIALIRCGDALYLAGWGATGVQTLTSVSHMNLRSETAAASGGPSCATCEPAASMHQTHLAQARERFASADATAWPAHTAAPATHWEHV
jgi:flagellar biogenesis protein FliO